LKIAEKEERTRCFLLLHSPMQQLPILICSSRYRRVLDYFLNIIYLVTRTGHDAFRITPSLTLPRSISLILLKPLTPMIIESNSPSLAVLSIS